MTKPGNSDPDEPDRADSENEPAHEPEPVERPEPEPADPEPLMAELEKAPPPPEEPVMPTAREAAQRPSEQPAPSVLRYSFYLFVAAGVLWVLSGIALLLNKQRYVDEQVKINKDPNFTREEISSAITQLFWLALVMSVTFAVFMALFSYKAREGTRRARTLLTIFGVFGVLLHIVFVGTLIALVGGILAVVGLVLLYAPSARAYFPPYQGR